MAQTNDIYSYYTPKLGKGGTCSITHELEETPYNLREILGGETKENNTILQNLNTQIENIQKQYSLDWIGIYQKRKNTNGETVLVKLAYRGEPSRAEFPLTKEFAEFSNNSTVGLTGKEIIVESVGDYDGPYYQCDAKVQSEFCAPLFGSDGEIIGIIDAESFTKKFFTEEILKVLRDFCSNISEKNLPQ